MVAQLINLGSVQAPYMEWTVTLAANEHRKINYVTDSFQLLDCSIQNVLRVSFGGTMVQTNFTAGMGYKLTEPVEFIELWNTSGSNLDVHFVVGIGEIKDNRLTVSGIVHTKQVATSGYTAITGGTSSLTQTLTLDTCDFEIMAIGGDVVIDVTGGNAGSYAVTSMTLPDGAMWRVSLALNSSLTITPASGASYSYTVGEY